MFTDGHEGKEGFAWLLRPGSPNQLGARIHSHQFRGCLGEIAKPIFTGFYPCQASTKALDVWFKPHNPKSNLSNPWASQGNNIGVDLMHTIVWTKSLNLSQLR